MRKGILYEESTTDFNVHLSPLREKWDGLE